MIGRMPEIKRGRRKTALCTAAPRSRYTRGPQANQGPSYLCRPKGALRKSANPKAAKFSGVSICSWPVTDLQQLECSIVLRCDTAAYFRPNPVIEPIKSVARKLPFTFSWRPTALYGTVPSHPFHQGRHTYMIISDEDINTVHRLLKKSAAYRRIPDDDVRKGDVPQGVVVLA